MAPEIETLRAKLERSGLRLPALSETIQHLTLKFLGETEPELVPKVVEVMQRVAEQVAPFDVQLRGLGAFPSRHNPSILWIGLRDEQTPRLLAEGLTAGLEPLGFQREARGYNPHITLLRLKSQPPRIITELLASEVITDFGGCRVEHIELYRSELLPEGPRYTVLRTVPLGGVSGN